MQFKSSLSFPDIVDHGSPRIPISRRFKQCLIPYYSPSLFMFCHIFTSTPWVCKAILSSATFHSIYAVSVRFTKPPILIMCSQKFQLYLRDFKCWCPLCLYFPQNLLLAHMFRSWHSQHSFFEPHFCCLKVSSSSE